MLGIEVVLLMAALAIGPDTSGASLQSPPPAVASPPPKLILLEQPSPQDMVDTYPKHAFAVQRDVTVTINCVVTPEGRFSDCIVDGKPVDLPEAVPSALRLAKLIRVALNDKDGRPLAGLRVKYRFTWTVN